MTTPKFAAAGEKSKQPKSIEMPFTFRCSHCKKDTAILTTKEEIKEDFVGDTKIICEYIEETETFEGNWFEITDDMKKGLKIACCDCEQANEGVSIHDGMELIYNFVDDDYPDGLPLQAVVRINRKESKTNWRVASFKMPKRK